MPDARAAVEALGCSVNEIRAPGTLDGGDILKVGDTVYVGRGGRTNADGVRQLRAAFEPLGARVVAVPVSRVLHLKSALTALPDGTVIGHPPLVDDPAAFPRFLPVPEESGAHVVLLGGGKLLMAMRRAPQRGALRGPGISAGCRGHQRVREAGGLCDLPVRAAARAVCMTGHHPPALRVPARTAHLTVPIVAP